MARCEAVTYASKALTTDSNSIYPNLDIGGLICFCLEYDDSSSQPDQLMETSVPIIDYNTCAQWFQIEQAQRPKPTAKEYIRQEG